MKKNLVLILALVLVFTACGANDGAEKKEDGKIARFVNDEDKKDFNPSFSLKIEQVKGDSVEEKDLIMVKKPADNVLTYSYVDGVFQPVDLDRGLDNDLPADSFVKTQKEKVARVDYVLVEDRSGVEGKRVGNLPGRLVVDREGAYFNNFDSQTGLISRAGPSAGADSASSLRNGDFTGTGDEGYLQVFGLEERGEEGYVEKLNVGEGSDTIGYIEQLGYSSARVDDGYVEKYGNKPPLGEGYIEQFGPYSEQSVGYIEKFGNYADSGRGYVGVLGNSSASQGYIEAFGAYGSGADGYVEKFGSKSSAGGRGYVERFGASTGSADGYIERLGNFDSDPGYLENFGAGDPFYERGYLEYFGRGDRFGNLTGAEDGYLEKTGGYDSTSGDYLRVFGLNSVNSDGYVEKLGY